jgi:hypothetical protein
VTDLSLAERGFQHLRDKAGRARPRPIALLAISATAGALAAMASAIAGASTLPGTTFTVWATLASAGFAVRVQLCLVVAVLLLLLDRSGGGTYPGQRALFVVLVGAGALGVAMNLTAMGVTLAREGAPPVGAPRLAGSWAAVVCSSLVPALLAGLTSGLGLHGAWSAGKRTKAAQ